MATYWENSCSFGLRFVLWYKYLSVSLFISHLGFWSGNLFLIAPFSDLCLLVPLYGPKIFGATTLLSADGSTLLTDKEAILKRWTEQSKSVLNRPSSINEDAIDRLPQIECNVLLDEFPTVIETRKAVQQLSPGKAPGADAIPAEVYKAGGLPMAEKLTELFHCMWRKEAIPQEFKNASIIHIYKRKGNPQACENHRGISLLS